MTSLPLKTYKENVQIINGSWYSQALTDLEIRDLYNNSEFVIITLKDTFQPSGQSTALQAMSCAKAVMITDIKGIWDRKLLKHKDNIYFLKKGDPKDLIDSVRLFLRNNNFKRNKGFYIKKIVKDLAKNDRCIISLKI